MLNEPERHDRRSIRLTGHDYSRRGAYFVTICIQGRVGLFGEVLDENMIPNAAGSAIGRIWAEIPARFPGVELGASIVMPNHLHGIVLLHPLESSAEPKLGQIVGAFKSLSTLAYGRGVREQGWRGFRGRLWQRNYYEHIIRNEEEFARIVNYIEWNPKRWAFDRENPSPIGKGKAEDFEV